MTSNNDIFKREGSERYTVFPITHPVLWDFYQKHAGTIWFPAEVKLHDDLVDWNTKLTDNERYFLKNVLAFFAASDGIVNENLIQNFYNEVQIPEARQFYAMQMLIEAVHSEQYALLIDSYVSDTTEKQRLFNAIENIPAIKKKADWAIKWIEEGSAIQQVIPHEHLQALHRLLSNQGAELTDESKAALHHITRPRPSFAQRLLAYVCVEGIFFSGAFCAIYWLKSRGLMPGLATANQFISRDENLHAEFAVELYKMLKDKLDEAIVQKVFKEAVEIEKEFITQSLPVSLIGMNTKLMSTYIEYVADRWLTLLGYSKIYNAINPFPFMELLSLNEKVNFFEGVNTQYSRANVGHKEEDRTIAFDADF
jgi:ribonucleoside-diphosphate reductase beta chain